MCTVMVANYNGSGMIESCLRSVFGQRCSFDFEVIVHDDASTDDSARLIREQFPDVRLIASPENVGFCIANNRMAAVARGRYLLLLNNDAELFPDALTTLRAAATTEGDDAVLGLPEYDLRTRALVARGHWLDPFLNPVPNLDPGCEEVAMVIGACLWLPRRLWSEVGGFPEWFGSIAEDMHLCTRARLQGHPVRVPARSGYWHASGASFGGGKVVAGRLSTTVRRRALSERNKTFVMLTCYPTPLLQAVLPFHLLWLLAEGAILALVKRDAALWRRIYGSVFGAIWRQRGDWIRERRTIQARRRVGVLSFLRPFVAFPYKLRMLFRHGIPEVK
ncbi:MAG: glycosyltransferase family 2 protein [Pseudomonadota bacterium]